MTYEHKKEKKYNAYHPKDNIVPDHYEHVREHSMDKDKSPPKGIPPHGKETKYAMPDHYEQIRDMSMDKDKPLEKIRKKLEK